MNILKLESSTFPEGGWIPIRYSARGENRSPGFELNGIASGAKSIAITLDDASHPLFPNYNHRVIWNLPVQAVIPEGISKGKSTAGDTNGEIQKQKTISVFFLCALPSPWDILDKICHSELI